MKTLFLQVRELFQRNQAYKLTGLLFLLICFGGWFIKNLYIEDEKTSMRWGYTFFGSIFDVDPTAINSIYESNLIENIYSRLLEYDNSGQIVCSLCTSFNIDGNKINFFFENASRTKDGHLINEIDAKESIERILLLQTNTHGSLKHYIGEDFTSAIRTEKGLLSIEVLRSSWVPFVLSLLTSMDFSIVPRGSVSKNDSKIVDYNNTSGLFYVHSETKSSIKLKSNKFHLRYKPNIIDEIEIVRIKSGEAKTAFANGSIDIIDPTYYAYTEDIETILRSVSDAQMHRTLQIGLTSLVFSHSSMSKSTQSDRVAAARVLKKWFLEETDSVYGSKETNEYFQSFGNGFITSEQKSELDTLFASSDASKYKFIFGLTEKYRKWAEKYEFPDFIEVRFFQTYPGFLPENEKPDIYLVTADSSFDEDISALSYLFSQGIFSYGRDDGAFWIRDYMDLPERHQRIEKLRDLHFSVLKSLKVAPIISRPYIAICNPKFKMDFSKLYAGSPMWKVWKK